MRSAAPTWLLVLCMLAACSTTESRRPTTEDDFPRPNALVEKEIEARIAQIPFLHREKLVDDLLWLVQRGAEAVPALRDALRHEDPKVRSNCAWVIGRIGDHRTVAFLRPLLQDDQQTVRLEAARSLVLLGDMSATPVLIEGLDSEHIHVRHYCHEALKHATGRDFDYDHLSGDAIARSQAVYRWRQWWSEQSGDRFFAQRYAEEHNLTPAGAEPAPDAVRPPQGQPAMPLGETAPEHRHEQPDGTQATQPTPVRVDGVEGAPGATDPTPSGVEAGPDPQPGQSGPSGRDGPDAQNGQGSAGGTEGRSETPQGSAPPGSNGSDPNAGSRPDGPAPQPQPQVR